MLLLRGCRVIDFSPAGARVDSCSLVEQAPNIFEYLHLRVNTSRVVSNIQTNAPVFRERSDHATLTLLATGPLLKTVPFFLWIWEQARERLWLRPLLAIINIPANTRRGRTAKGFYHL